MSDGYDGKCCSYFVLISNTYLQNIVFIYMYTSVHKYVLTNLKSAGSGTRGVLEDNNDTGGFSEHELLDIMYNACNTSNTGKQ